MEKIFYFLTFIAQGASFLNPRAYSQMHQEHHAYSDDLKDPHSPKNFSHVGTMMLATYKYYQKLVTYQISAPKVATHKPPSWPTLDRLADSWIMRAFWISLYILIYRYLAVPGWAYFLLPVQAMMGPIQGAIVNWCGHRYGYRNFATKDVSKNTLPQDWFLMGELYQNNHHHDPASAKFSQHWWEIDLAYLALWLMSKLKLISFDIAKPTESSGPRY
jgi:stearoyl-CoA desaturase (delta-9 desaturase)